MSRALPTTAGVIFSAERLSHLLLFEHRSRRDQSHLQGVGAHKKWRARGKRRAPGYDKVYNRLKTRKARGKLSLTSGTTTCPGAFIQGQGRGGKNIDFELKMIYDKM
jgi:hypothetical protein